jgi:hypothetical protein
MINISMTIVYLCLVVLTLDICAVAGIERFRPR